MYATVLFLTLYFPSPSKVVVIGQVRMGTVTRAPAAIGYIHSKSETVKVTGI